jgi:cytochrome c biogenesis protein CcdA
MLERELPAVVARREGASLVPLDIVEPENLQRLVGVMQVHRSREGNLPVAVVGDRYLAGIDRVRRELPDAVMSARTTGAPAPGDLRAAFGAITIGAVILAGLVDGLNPCAFATAVFLASFLAARRRPTFDVVVAGALFTSAVFATYLAIGYGLAHLATALTAAAVSWATAAIALVFAALSVRDAVVYARTGEASKVAVRLPDAVKARVHGAIGGMRVAIYGGALAAGVIVTLLEAVCTGQIYVPVIVAMTRESARAHGLLVLYNLAFVLPLVGVLGFAVAGTKWTRMAEWSKRNVVAAKVMMAAVLVAMAGYLVWR